MNNNIQSNKSAATPANSEQQAKGLTPVRCCPFCGEDCLTISAYSRENASELDGPLFKWHLKIRCECCAEFNYCLELDEIIDAWNGSSAEFMNEGWDLDMLKKNFEQLPLAGADQEVDLHEPQRITRNLYH